VLASEQALLDPALDPREVARISTGLIGSSVTRS